MFHYDKFLNEYGPGVRFYSFSEQEIKNLGQIFHENIVLFLKNEGISSFGKRFFWSVNPLTFKDILAMWGIKNGHVFIRTAFGACIYFQKDEYFYLDPFLGRIVSLDDDAYLILNYSLRTESILENAFFKDQFDRLIPQPESLQVDEMFSLHPALPLGGSFETSRFEIVKMREHLSLLAQLFNGKAKKIKL
jgi:hypothetical protein